MPSEVGQKTLPGGSVRLASEQWAHRQATPRTGEHRRSLLRWRALSCVACWVLLAGLAAAADMAVDRSEAEDLIAGLVQLVREHYVLPDRVDTIAAQLRQGLSSGEYEGSEDAQEMTLKITADLRESSGDLHFGIRPKPPTAAPKSRPGAARRSSDESSVPAPSRTVSGLGRVDTLAGDIGYIEVVAFPDPALGEAAVDEAFDRLAGTRAMILDLRRSRGGHPGMVAYLLSYFFDGEPFLFNRLEWPSSGKTLEFETVADLPSPRFTGRPVFILTSRGTPSAAEGFSYHMQHLGRALVVGERTAGAAHLNQMFELPGYQVAIPTGRPVSPITGGNWEGSGVVPDYEVAADQALDAGLELAADRARGR